MWSPIEFQRAAEAAFSRGDTQTGSRLCREAITKYPDHLEAVCTHARMLAGAAQTDEARDIARQLVSEGDDLHRWQARGCVFRELGMVNEAIVSFERACDHSEAGGMTYYLLGCALHDSGHHRRALSALSKASELSPDEPDVWMQKGRTLMTTGLFEAATHALREALALEHDDALSMLRRTLMYSGQLDLANAPELHDDAQLGVATERAATLGDLTLRVRYFSRESGHPEMIESVVTGLLDYVREELVQSKAACAHRVIPFGLATLTLIPEEHGGWILHEHRWSDGKAQLRPEVTDAVELMLHTGLLHRRLGIELEPCTIHDLVDIDPGVFEGSAMVWHRVSPRRGNHSGWQLLSTTNDGGERRQLPIGELAALNLFWIHPLTLPVGWKVYFEGAEVTGIEDPSGQLR